MQRSLSAVLRADPQKAAELEAAQALHRQQARRRQKERAAKFLEGVDAAIAEGASQIAYSTLKYLRPWQAPSRAQLKDSHGKVMSSAEELEELRKFASDTFGVHSPLAACTQSLPRLSPELLAKHIGAIKPHKAVPQGSAPAAAWKLCASEVSVSLSNYLASVESEVLPPGLLDADLCLIPKPGEPADKPKNLRPLGILRPDAKGVAGAARELLSPGIRDYMREVPQFAYLPGRGLSDAHSRIVRHLQEVRQLCGTASPSRQELRAGALRPDLVGGITFALDLSQAFDTVSRQEILEILPELSADPDLVALVHALHHKSSYRLAAQGSTATVETTTGIKTGCKLAPSLFALRKELVQLFGEQKVKEHFTGYADDLTIHRTIRSPAELEECHKLIRSLLDSLQQHKLFRNSAKCYILAKFAGKMAPAITRARTAWTKDDTGAKVKLWRIGRTKYFPAFKWVSEIKYLGIKASYGPFEMQTLRFRMAEAKQKLHLVRKFVYNRRIASTVSRLRVWLTVIWPTLSFGLAEVGLSQESARSLKAWYAFKLRSVLNKPAHISRMTTQELFEQYSIEDPVVKLQRLQDNRGKRLQAQLTLRPDITCAEQVIVRSTQVSAALAQHVATPIPEDDQGEPLLRCAHCSKMFVTEQGLRLRIAKSHSEQVKRYVPSSFNRQVHAEGGVPTCRACKTNFKQWPGLLSHLLSGACPCPQALEDIDRQGAPSELPAPLSRLRASLSMAPRSQLPAIARSQDSQELSSQCVVCGFWSPDYTKLKSHIRKVHTQAWEQHHEATSKTCSSFSALTPKGLKCPFCRLLVYNKKTLKPVPSDVSGCLSVACTETRRVSG